MGAESNGPVWRSTVGLTVAVAFLGIATGVTVIGTEAVAWPLRVIVPAAVRRLAGFTGVVASFLLLVAAYGLQRGYRLAWYATVVLLTVVAAHGVLQASPFSLVLLVVAFAALAVVVRDRRRFDRRFAATSSPVIALATLFGMLLYGVVGTYTLRGQFTDVSTPLDALYFTVDTATTIGFGDVHATSSSSRLFVLSLVVLGPSVVAATVGVVVEPLFRSRRANGPESMTDITIDRLDDHVVVLGRGQGVLATALSGDREDADFVVVVPEGDEPTDLDGSDVPVLAGSLTDDETLDRAGVDRARAVVVATGDDATTALAVLGVREAAPDVRVVAAARDETAVAKLERAGADAVVGPASVGDLLVASALDDGTDHVVDGRSRDSS